MKSFKTVKGPQPIISVKYDDGSIGVVDANDLRVIPNSSAANSRAVNCGVSSSNAAVQAALNSSARNMSNTFDGTPIDRFVKQNICSKFPEANLEGYTQGAVKYWTKANGTKTILADRTARPYLDVIKTKFDADYAITPVDYGRGVTGFTMKPRAHAARGEFEVVNAVSHNARPLGKGEILRRGDYVETPWDGAIGLVVGVKILDRDKGSAVYKVKMEKTGTFFDFPGHHLKVV